MDDFTHPKRRNKCHFLSRPLKMRYYVDNQKNSYDFTCIIPQVFFTNDLNKSCKVHIYSKWRFIERLDCYQPYKF